MRTRILAEEAERGIQMEEIVKRGEIGPGKLVAGYASLVGKRRIRDGPVILNCREKGGAVVLFSIIIWKSEEGGEFEEIRFYI